MSNEISQIELKKFHTIYLLIYKIMKTRNLFLSTTTLFFLNACTTTFYQVYQATPSQNITNTGQWLVYEDDHCKVLYNLWEEGGNIGFTFMNKTDNNLYLHLDKSYFIFNGRANNYFKNRVFTTMSTQGVASARSAAAAKKATGTNTLGLLQTNAMYSSATKVNSSSTGYSVAYQEEKVICIPANSSKLIAEYNINNLLHRDCDLYRYPTRKQVKTMTYDKNDSPMVFSNRLTYSVGNDEQLIQFENEFYVSSVTNYPEKEITELKNDEYCGQKSFSKIKYFKSVGPDKFFLKYLKGQDGWKH